MAEIPDLLSTRGAARVLGVTTRTVHRLAESETLRPAFRIDGLRGAFLFHESEVRDLADKRRNRQPVEAE